MNMMSQCRYEQTSVSDPDFLRRTRNHGEEDKADRNCRRNVPFFLAARNYTFQEVEFLPDRYHARKVRAAPCLHGEVG